MSDDSTMQRQIEELNQRLGEIRTVKHQMCNELMGVFGHSELLSQQPALSDTTRHREERIREHCRHLNDQAGELTRLCLLATSTG